jgi:hypothetical protein
MANVKGIVGSLAVLVWLVVFAAGLLIDSKPYRDRIRHQPDVAMAATMPTEGTGSRPTPAIPAARTSDDVSWRAFGVTMLVYTPLNAALLVLIAGFIGGCASNITYSAQQSSMSPAGDGGPARVETQEQRVLFRTENPFASMLRSFLIYIGFIAGIYITGNAPFADPSPDQYVRFVGTLSLLAFVVGYDPTKFQDLISIVPRPGGSQTAR